MEKSKLTGIIYFSNHYKHQTIDDSSFNQIIPESHVNDYNHGSLEEMWYDHLTSIVQDDSHEEQRLNKLLNHIKSLSFGEALLWYYGNKEAE